MHDITTTRRASHLRDGTACACFSPRTAHPSDHHRWHVGLSLPRSGQPRNRDPFLSPRRHLPGRAANGADSREHAPSIAPRARVCWIPEPILVREAISAAMERHRYDFPDEQGRSSGASIRVTSQQLPSRASLDPPDPRAAWRCETPSSTATCKCRTSSRRTMAESATISVCNSGKPLTLEEYGAWVQPFYRGPGERLSCGLWRGPRAHGGGGDLRRRQSGSLVAEPWEDRDGTEVTFGYPRSRSSKGRQDGATGPGKSAGQGDVADLFKLGVYICGFHIEVASDD